MYTFEHAWPATPASIGTRFFAQAFRAFLDEESFEGFRAYSLDTVGRLAEADKVLSEVLAKRMVPSAATALLDELEWSLSHDDVALDLSAGFGAVLLDKLKGTGDFDSKQKAIRAVLSRLAGYKSQLIERIASTINDAKRKSECLSATGFLVSHLLSDGHDGNFLISKVTEKFFAKPVKKVGGAVVRSFLNSISESKREYVVVFWVNSEARTILQTSNAWDILGFGQLRQFCQDGVSIWPDHKPDRIFVSRKVIASDPHAAVIEVVRLFDQEKSMTVLFPKSSFPTSGIQYLVHTPRGNKAENLMALPSQMPGFVSNVIPTKKLVAGHRTRDAARFAQDLRAQFDQPSRERLLLCLSTIASARKNLDDETRLITAWSSFEVLLGSPPEPESRIGYFVKNLVPVVVARYHRQLFSNVHDRILVNHRKELAKIFDTEPFQQFGNRHTAFCDLIVSPGHGDEQKRILSLVADNQLLLHRLFRLQKFYGSPSLALSTIDDHERRVQWQISRIYRVRNTLVHSGTPLVPVGSLLHNSVEYLRSAVFNILKVASKAPGESDIDQSIAEVSMEFARTKLLLKDAHSQPFDAKLVSETFGTL